VVGIFSHKLGNRPSKNTFKKHKNLLGKRCIKYGNHWDEVGRTNPTEIGINPDNVACQMANEGSGIPGDESIDFVFTFGGDRGHAKGRGEFWHKN
jgi:hypothetical protein